MYLQLNIKFLFCLIILFLHNSIGKLNVQRRIHGGNEVKIEDFPHAAALQKLIGVNLAGLRIGPWMYECGGTIIHKRAILTAQRCITTMLSLRFIVGTNKLYTFWNSNENIANIDRIIEDESSEMALAILEKSLSLSEKIRTARLSHNIALTALKGGIIAGWGATSKGFNMSPSRQLISIQVEFCKDNQDSSSICTKGKDEGGGCDDDAGSGLIIEYNEEQFLYGVLIDSSNENDCNVNSYERTFPANWIIDAIISLKQHENVSE